MSILTDAIGGLVSSLGDQAVKMRTAITGHDLAADAAYEQAALAFESLKEQGQQAADAAQSGYWTATLGVTGSNFFKFWVAGARPLILWVCGVAFLLQYVVLPIGAWCGAHWPPLDMGVPTQVVLGALGLGQIVTRGIEKINGAAGNH